MREDIEMKIYELLGIKKFKKMAFTLRDTLAIPFTYKMSKEERRKSFNNFASNYNLGKVRSIEDIKKFKRQLFFNTSIHVGSGILCLTALSNATSIPFIIADISCITINLYCIMLQRYNNIRINKVIRKMTPRYEKEKNEIKEELKKEDSLLLNHSYKIVDNKNKETNITFDELINNASIEELKQYRSYLNYLKDFSNEIRKDESFNDNYSIELPVKKNKTLKLEIKKSL